MEPEAQEIEKVGVAFITIGSPDYTPLQKNYLSDILNSYALEMDQQELREVFKDKEQVIEALKVLNEFAIHYQNEKEIMDEFNEEIENLLITINQYDEGIII